MRRRRFLTLAAAFACAPRLAQAATWTGTALGAEVSVTLNGPRGEVEAALRDIPAILSRVEAAFSIYRSESEVSTLNRTGRLIPSDMFRDLTAEVDRAHALTGGLFDPTVQPLWLASANGHDPAQARAAVGWDRVRFDARAVRLGAGPFFARGGSGYVTCRQCL